MIRSNNGVHRIGRKRRLPPGDAHDRSALRAALSWAVEEQPH